MSVRTSCSLGGRGIGSCLLSDMTSHGQGTTPYITARTVSLLVYNEVKLNSVRLSLFCSYNELASVSYSIW